VLTCADWFWSCVAFCDLALQAAVNGHPRAVELLLAAGADPSLPNSAGRTVWDMAKTEEVDVLLTGSTK
jgi:ankyrin repeat protein